jgi:hypothetical protein
MGGIWEGGGRERGEGQIDGYGQGWGMWTAHGWLFETLNDGEIEDCVVQVGSWDGGCRAETLESGV